MFLYCHHLAVAHATVIVHPARHGSNVAACLWAVRCHSSLC
jgi:hypothetical protein